MSMGTVNSKIFVDDTGTLNVVPSLVAPRLLEKKRVYNIDYVNVMMLFPSSLLYY